jgi:DNA-binding transcriptional regulator GbsR (MarR family)
MQHHATKTIAQKVSTLIELKEEWDESDEDLGPSTSQKLAQIINLPIRLVRQIISWHTKASEDLNPEDAFNYIDPNVNIDDIVPNSFWSTSSHEKIMKFLDPRYPNEIKYICMYHGIGYPTMSVAEIAEQEGVSKAYIYIVLKKGLNRLAAAARSAQ